MAEDTRAIFSPQFSIPTFASLFLLQQAKINLRLSSRSSPPPPLGAPMSEGNNVAHTLKTVFWADRSSGENSLGRVLSQKEDTE